MIMSRLIVSANYRQLSLIMALMVFGVYGCGSSDQVGQITVASNVSSTDTNGIIGDGPTMRTKGYKPSASKPAAPLTGRRSPVR